MCYHNTNESKVTRFASKSRATICSDLVGNDTSSIALSDRDWDSESTSTAKSSGSRKTLTGAPLHRRAGSSISNLLAAQRGPAPPPPLMGDTRPASARAASSGGDGDASNGGKRLSRRASFFSKFKK